MNLYDLFLPESLFSFVKLKNFQIFIFFDERFPKQEIYQGIFSWKFFKTIYSSYWDILIFRYASTLKVHKISEKVQTFFNMFYFKIP